MNKLLIFNSNKFSGGTINLLEKVFYALSGEHKIFYYGVEKHSAESRLISKAVYKKYNPKILITKNSFLVFLYAPVLFVKFFVKILFWRTRGVKKIVCFGLTEKIFTFIPAKIFGIKIFWAEWEILPFYYKSGYFRFWYNFFGRKVAVITVVKKIGEQLIKLKFKEENIYNIYPGIDIEKFLQKTVVSQFSSNEIFRIGTICKLGKNKGIEQLMRAVKNSLQFIPNLRLTIVGDGKERKSLMWLARQLEITEVVQFSGFQSNINTWIKSFAIFVYPNMVEKAFSLTVLQAMAYARPVVVFNAGALSEFVSNMRSGVVVEKGDIKELTQAIVYLNRHKKESEDMGERGRGLVLEKYNTEKMMADWKKIIR